MLNRCALYGNNGLGGTVRTKQVAGCGTFVVSQKSSNRDLGKGGKRKKPWVIADSGLHFGKDGGLLLSRIALQYHRRKRA